MTPRTLNAVSPGTSALLRIIRDQGPVTRAHIMERTGLGRTAVTQRVEALLDRGLVRQAGDAPSTGGRPANRLVFNAAAGLILTADLGARHAHVALADLSGIPLAELTADIEIAAGPDTVLAWVQDRFDDLLEQRGHTVADVWGVGMGVPGPVEFASGRPINPPIMPGWDGVEIPAYLSERFPVPVLVDNDVNIMALGEHSSTWPRVDSLLFIKVATGIGCGIMAYGQLYRGAHGAAGDIGHVRVGGHDDVVCECGNTGCVEAVAGGRALVRQVQALGLTAHESRDVVALVRAQNIEVVHLVREAGRALGEVLAGLVNALNPGLIVIGGDVAEAHEQLFAGVRERIYQRSTPLATQHLSIARSRLGDRAGVIGAARMAIEHLLAPEALDSANDSGH